MTRSASRGASLLLALAVLHVLALTSVRLVTDADDFNNWDLISLVNANAFPTLGEALSQPEVHFTNPFRFPGYNTGAESVLSILIHRAMSGISLYWSNTVVVVVYDVFLLAGLWALFRLVWRDTFTQAAAWMLTGMSTALLTFLALSAFNVQAYATIVAALVGCELLLQSRPRGGIALVAVAFLFISQAYPLTFFLPLFCLVWTAARAMMAMASEDVDTTALFRGVKMVGATVLACVLVVEAASLGTYIGKIVWVVHEPIESQQVEATTTLAARVADFFGEAFRSGESKRNPGPGFAPFFLWIALALVAAASPFVRRRNAVASRDHGGRGVPAWLRPWLPVAAWSGLVFFGYMPAMFGTSLKSQRCVFGDLFLAMAVANAAAWLVRGGLPRGAVAAALVALLAGSDLVYARAFLSQDHQEVHRPVFDYDVADGAARHDLDASLDYMREQIRWKNSALLVYYPSGRNENTTDPAMFYARFLRRVGRFDRAHWIFPCRFCQPRYGCPFPDVLARSCRKDCCYFDPIATLDRRPELAKKRLYFWWFEDADSDDTPRRDRLLAALRHRYWTKDLGTPAPERRWRVFELTPREGNPDPEPGSHGAGRAETAKPASSSGPSRSLKPLEPAEIRRSAKPAGSPIAPESPAGVAPSSTPPAGR